MENAKPYALKSKELTGPTKGVIFLEIDVIFNAVKAGLRTLIPIEQKYNRRGAQSVQTAAVAQLQQSSSLHHVPDQHRLLHQQLLRMGLSAEEHLCFCSTYSCTRIYLYSTTHEDILHSHRN
ncbi:hypothetical protein KUCAC02_028607 [Chaenocephalus aceratus]|uniref:Uncharacterized protein n=1 Tax=Chaenocephalus aceratus TaxID=36190 RepID=A0ACB9X2B5_CHAAC|nr:hypothetical protein KUCAC02_028607 [Chaenocephalus aceratus]